MTAGPRTSQPIGKSPYRIQPRHARLPVRAAGDGGRGILARGAAGYRRRSRQQPAHPQPDRDDLDCGTGIGVPEQASMLGMKRLGDCGQVLRNAEPGADIEGLAGVPDVGIGQ